MIHTNVREVSFKGLNLLIEQNAIKKPKGIDSIRVSMNSRQVKEKPSKRLFVTERNDIAYSCI